MPYLTLLEKGSAKTHRVEGSEVLAGRDPACGLCLDGDEAKTVSGRHARFFLDNGRWFVEDFGSRNGTYIGTRRVEAGSRHQLSAGDVVGLGMLGSQLSVIEVVGRSLMATMVESTPPPNLPSRPAGGTTAVQPSTPDRQAAPASAIGELRVALRSNQNGALFAATGDRITIGRALECLIRVEGDNATSVSRVHVEIIAVAGLLSVRDGGSRHGTYLNGVRIDGTSAIRVGDVLMLGPGGPAFVLESAQTGSELFPPAARGNEDAFRSELPTAAIDRPAAQKPVEAAPPLGLPSRPATIGRKGETKRASGEARRLAMLRTAKWVGVITLATLAAGVMALIKIKLDRAEEKVAVANANLRQQSSELESLRAAASREVLVLRASLDSAERAAAPAGILDSLRLSLAEAERKALQVKKPLSPN